MNILTLMGLQCVLSGARNVPLRLLSVLVSFVAQNALAIFQAQYEVYSMVQKNFPPL